jgi:hypothetical protein
MKYIESVRVLTSQIDDGDNTHSGLAVIIDPMPDNKEDLTLLGDAIRAAVQEVSKKE